MAEIWSEHIIQIFFILIKPFRNSASAILDNTTPIRLKMLHRKMVITHNTPEKSLSEHIMKARRCNAQLVCALNLYSYDVMCKNLYTFLSQSTKISSPANSQQCLNDSIIDTARSHREITGHCPLGFTQCCCKRCSGLSPPSYYQSLRFFTKSCI